MTPPAKPNSPCRNCGRPFSFVERDGALALDPRAAVHPLVYWQQTWEGHEDCVAYYESRARKISDMSHEYHRKRKVEASGVDPSITLSMVQVDDDNRVAYNTLLSWEPGQKGILLIGPPGTGKTFLLQAFASAKHVGGGLRFVNVNAELNRLRGMSGDDYGAVEDAIDELAAASILILDDLGAEKLTEFGETVLERLLSARFDNDRATFVSSNLKREAFRQKFSPRIVSRVAGLIGKTIELGGPDRRRLKKETAQ